MSRIETSSSVKIPEDIEIIEKLELSVEDNGLMISAKSTLIEEWAKKISKGRTIELSAENNDDGLRGNLYRLPPAIGQYCNITPAFRTQPSSVFWIAMEGLGEGVKILFHRPVLAPGDLVEYAHSACDQIRTLYNAMIRRDVLKVRMVEKYDED